MTHEPYEMGGESGNPEVSGLKTARKHFSKLGWGVFLILLAGTVAQVLAAVVEQLAFPGASDGGWGFWLWAMVPLYLIGFPVGILVLRRAPGIRLERKDLKISHLLILIPISICMMYAGNLVGSLVNGLIRMVLGLPAADPVEDLVTGTELLPRILFVVLLGPALEELVFRKMLIDRMAPYGEKTAVILSALIFGLFHGNFAQLFYAAALGLVFGYVYLRTGKLRYSILLHAFINFMGGVVAPAVLEGVPEEVMTGALEDLSTAKILEALPGILAMYGYSLLMIGAAIAGLVLICVYRGKLLWKPAPQELPKKGRIKALCLNGGMLFLLLGCLVMIALSLFAE